MWNAVQMDETFCLTRFNIAVTELPLLLSEREEVGVGFRRKGDSNSYGQRAGAGSRGLLARRQKERR